MPRLWPIASLLAPCLLLPASSAAQVTSSDMGSGAAWLDYDADGDLDLLFLTPLGAVRLYESADGASFTDMTAIAIPPEIETKGDPGLGISCGDLNNDGFEDVVLTMNGRNRLLLNMGNGTFALKGSAAGIGGNTMSASNVVFDYDNDGLLDIYITNYMGVANQMWHCTGINVDGVPQYVDVAPALGLDYAPNGQSDWGLGATVADFDNDGDMDLYVGNDYNGVDLVNLVLNPGDNIYYRNNGDGTFTDATDEAGLREHGWAMGVAHGDFDNDGWLDIFVANFFEDALYRNNGDGTFTDVTMARGIITGDPSEWHYNGWGTAFLDYDNDGDLDIHVANGFIPNDQGQVEDEPDQLFENRGPDQGFSFIEVSAASGVGANIGDSRGASYGDMNRDGFMDILVINNDYLADGTDPKTFPARCLFVNQGNGTFTDEAYSHGFRNDYADGPSSSPRGDFTGNGWLQVHVRGTRSNRSAIGARVEVTAGGVTHVRQLGGGSYCSTDSPFLHFGLGASQVAEEVTVRYPAGGVVTLHNVAANQIMTLVEPDVTPVRLLSFGLASAADGVRVRWSWSDDHEVSSFRVTRRQAGETAVVADRIGPDAADLEVIDTEAPTGTLVYELYAVLRDGTVERLAADTVYHLPSRTPVLGQNFPNPFSGATRIPVYAPASGTATVDILSVDGRAVRTLVAPVAAGNQDLDWDGRDDGGARVAPGVYFYRLRGAGAETARKLILRP